MQHNQMKQILIQRKQKHATSWTLSMTSCAVEGQVCPDQHVANIIPSFRLRSLEWPTGPWTVISPPVPWTICNKYNTNIKRLWLSIG